MIFNTNNHVKVKLTELGRRVYRERFDELYREYPRIHAEYSPPVEDEEGYSEFLLWELMQIFGPKMGNGFDLVFETEIIIPEPPTPTEHTVATIISQSEKDKEDMKLLKLGSLSNDSDNSVATMDEYYNKDGKDSLAIAIVYDILGDLTDRRGLRHEFDQIDRSIQDEILKCWTGIVRKQLEK